MTPRGRDRWADSSATDRIEARAELEDAPTFGRAARVVGAGDAADQRLQRQVGAPRPGAAAGQGVRAHDARVLDDVVVVEVVRAALRRRRCSRRRSSRLTPPRPPGRGTPPTGSRERISLTSCGVMVASARLTSRVIS